MNRGARKTAITVVVAADVIAALPVTYVRYDGGAGLPHGQRQPSVGRQREEHLPRVHRPGERGYRLEVFGIDVVYDSPRPAGQRLVSIILTDGTPFDMGREYLLASNDHIMAGDDSYPSIAGLEIEGTFGLVNDILFDYFRTAGDMIHMEHGRQVDLESS